MSKHTPGPWIQGKRHDEKPKAIIDPSFVQPWINIDPAPKNDLDILNGMGCICKVTGPDRENNARLIAAAPEMLDALKIAIGCIREQDATIGHASACLPMLESIVAKAQE